MAQPRLAMQKIKDVLRLHLLGGVGSCRQLARAVGCGKSAVADCLRRAKVANISLQRQRSDPMNRPMVPRPDERPSFQTTSDARQTGSDTPSLIVIATICCLGLLVSLCAAIYGLDLSTSWP